jgi:probable F420-dependent oxidoreductase|tara:strand:+ start:3721 stop:4662 length:942 start_codon:yes stop_codon:yes gene_type:complete
VPDNGFKIGVNLSDVADTARHAKLSEDLGFDFVGAGEHIMRDDPSGPTQIALSALAVAAGATERVSLLSSIVIAPLHHPVLLAKEAAVVDLASAGRLILGIGVAGEFPAEFEAMNIPVNQRGTRADETIEVARAIWSGPNASHHGKRHNFDGFTLSPGTHSPGGPPIWAGGRSESAMERATRAGDGWLPYLFTPSQYARGAGQVREMLEKRGRGDEADFGYGLHLMTALGSTHEKALDSAAKGLSEAYRYSGSYEDLAERYVLLGPPEEAAERINEFREAGAGHILLSWVTPFDEIDDQIAIAGEGLLPLLRG